jgi:hypothetical protein
MQFGYWRPAAMSSLGGRLVQSPSAAMIYVQEAEINTVLLLEFSEVCFSS